MTVLAYLKDKKLILLFQAACMAGCFAFFYLLGFEKNQSVLFLTAWCCVIALWMVVDFWRRRAYWNQIQNILSDLEKPYLLSELMPKSFRLEDQLYQQILRKSNKSVIDAVHELENSQKEYKDFIENWIHEVKVPLTSLYLICGNEKTAEMRRIRGCLGQLENDVEKALFYARSDTVSQDYMIREMDLYQTAVEVIQRGSDWLIQNRAQIDLENVAGIVYSDDKWIEFILNQLLINAVKYKKGDSCQIRMSTQKLKNETVLSVWDYGIGIKDSEIHRIFDKGFTGSNGREQAFATGIGLYLCRKLCRKLGIGISAESKEGEYTCISLHFPDGSSHFSFLSKV